MKKYVLAALTLVITVVMGCDDSNITKLSDDELRDRVHKCDYAVNLTPAEHQVCHNYHRECERRLEREGRFVCK